MYNPTQQQSREEARVHRNYLVTFLGGLGIGIATGFGMGYAIGAADQLRLEQENIHQSQIHNQPIKSDLSDKLNK